MSDQYVPGSCNIGPDEIALRRRVGHAGLAVTAALGAALLRSDLHPGLAADPGRARGRRGVRLPSGTRALLRELRVAWCLQLRPPLARNGRSPATTP